jgi:putative heme iron utilization protein
MQKNRKDVIRPTDEDARRLARRLARSARFGALAALEPESGHPFASRVLIGTDIDGVPVMLSSLLATHTRAIIADPRCSLLVGEPGKGDPLAWPRLTILTDAEPLKHDSESHSLLRERFLRRHPKARLYVDFGDFSFFRLVPKSASLNGGFGKAFFIEGEDLIIPSALIHAIASHELHLIKNVSSICDGAADRLVFLLFNEKSTGWNIIGIDVCGMDFARKEQLLRFELDAPISDINGLIDVYKNVLI